MYMAIAVLLLASCARVPPADLSRDPQELRAQVRTAQERTQRVRGSARVRIDSPGGSGTVTEFIAAEKPDRVRLETLDFFGNPAAILVAVDGRFAFLDLRDNTFYRGAATAENVSRLLPVVIPVEELVTMLCGSAPVIDGTPLEARVDGGQLLLTIGRGPLGQRLAIGERATIESSRVRLSETGPGGAQVETAPAYDLEFDSFRDRSGIRYPDEMHLDAPAGQAHVDLFWRNDLEVNGRIDAGLFRLEPPRGARVVELGTGAIPPPELPRAGPRE
jgi:hypothetical protein